MIYIVEDDAEVREMETYALKSSCFDVMAFENGKAMDEKVKVKVPDLFILDIMLPGEDGVYSFFIYAFNINKCANPAKYHFFMLSMHETHSETGASLLYGRSPPAPRIYKCVIFLLKCPKVQTTSKKS